MTMLAASMRYSVIDCWDREILLEERKIGFRMLMVSEYGKVDENAEKS